MKPGAVLGPYRVVSELGAGGMGEVYRATDTRLGRDVAVKVLPPDVANDPDRLARFHREARAVAALNHPNIVTLHSVEEADGIHFLTMELVEGQALDQLIPAGGLDIPRILDIGVAMSDALAAAHERGIVHRDLKPANVMVTADGRVKVLDFGLAKEIQAPDEAAATMTAAGHTDAGVVMGTRHYMSPEQVQGRPLDHRSDIFSLGIVLYEMTTGRRPFEGQTSAELFASILRDDAPAVTELRADLPADLVRVIRRCLERDPRRRMQTARDVGNELREIDPVGSAGRAASAGSSKPAEDSGPTGVDEGFRIAVLPFKHVGSSTNLAALAEGLAEEAVTAFSRFSYLRVVTHGPAPQPAEAAVDPRTAGRVVGARYVLEGRLRQAGSRLRVTVQLVDVISGVHLWSDTYDRAFVEDEIFALVDDLVPEIASTVADLHGVLPRSTSDELRSRLPEDLSPYEAVLRSFAYFDRVARDDLEAARAGLESAIRRRPDHADAWAMLALLHCQDYGQGFDLQADALDRGLGAARRAVAAAPSHALAWFSLAEALFFHRELPSFREAAERAVSLNPMAGNSIAHLGELLAYAGDWERGLALVEHARQLNPHHPGWYWYGNFFDAYRRGDDRAALDFALKVNLPGHWGVHCAMAAVCGQLGDLRAGQNALRALLEIKPDFGATARAGLARWFAPDLVERIIDGLRKVGLDVPEADVDGRDAALPAPAATAAPEMQPATLATDASGASPSGRARADEGFWVGVLPFRYSGASAEIAGLADGLHEETITGLSRFSYLRVISRSASSSAPGAVDVRAVGREIGARYVMEGSLRQAGSQLRITVQLVDATTGAHLWAETFDRRFDPEAVFALQDDLVARIVATCADRFGVLPRSITDAVRSRDPGELTPYESLMRSFGYHHRLTPDEHAVARDALERAVKRAPANADCWAMLSWVYAHEFSHGFNPQPGSLDRALSAARRAIDLAPSGQLAHQALAVVHFFRKETAACVSTAEQAIALNPLDTANEAYFLITFTGDWERGERLIRQAADRNPHHPRWYELALSLVSYRQQRYREAIDLATRANAPDVFWSHWLLAAAHGQLGEQAAGRVALEALLTHKPDFAATGRALLAKWFDPALVDHCVDGLVKAGLDVSDQGS